jgi:N-acetylated-alpha-linked acidic dipeptidase
MRLRIFPWLLVFLPIASSVWTCEAQDPEQQIPFGFTHFQHEAAVEERFLAVPSAKLAGQELKLLTAKPHLAATPEDRQTALYVADKFRAAGLHTEIVPYRVLLNWPRVIHVEAFDASGKLLMSGPAREHVQGDPYQDNPQVVMPFNGSSASGDLTGDVVYANYGRPEDFLELAAQHIDLRGKIVIMRYGANFRGVKVDLAEQHGAAGVLLYSDPHDDGYFRGDAYPNGPWRPATSVQRGSVQFLFQYPGDPETPGFASTPDLPDTMRLSPEGNQPHIISIPISYHDAAPILQALGGPDAPADWQGALPFRYHLGPGGIRVHLVSQQDYKRRIIWDVIGTIPGSELPGEQVIVGNHRDAWVYGAADPVSGTAAMLEAIHGVGVLLRSGWRPRRTLTFCSWDGEEEGLIGSTEWVEQNDNSMSRVVAYFNTDIGVSGPNFTATAVPSLKNFVREIAQVVPSARQGTVYDQWRLSQTGNDESNSRPTAPDVGKEVQVGDLGSGSDFTPFLQHEGVPSTQVASTGAYGVYHSTFDDYAWFVMNADPHFLYLQQMARVLGLEAVRMADADVLPYDYGDYARAIGRYLDLAQSKASDAGLGSLDFTLARSANSRFADAAARVRALQLAPPVNPAQLDATLRTVESDLLAPAGLPGRPWYRHLIFAPGIFTGYEPVVLPGINEAIDAHEPKLAQEQLTLLAQALSRAAQTLDSAITKHP